jgi:DME family drug/metabolite transporter
MLIIYLVATFTVAVSTSLVGETVEVPTNFIELQLLFGLGVLSTAIAHTLYFSSLSNLKSFETATMALLEPIGATLIGVALFSEIPKPVFVLGAALMFLGIFSVTTKK